MRKGTKPVHAGRRPEAPHHPIVPPLYQSSTFFWPDSDNPPAYDYTRVGNPTRAVLEEALAAIEGADHGLAQATGMAAVTTAVSLLRPGDHLLAPVDIYGGTHRLFESHVKPGGVEVSYVDATRPDCLEEAIQENTKMVWLETPTNPTLAIVDLALCSEIARARGALTVADNTFATPYYQNPLDLGCDIVMHSTTKYINGHSDVVGGALTWRSDALTEGLRGYANSAGNTPSPFDSWLTLRGLQTLGVRMERHSSNALRVAEWLCTRPEIEAVMYPGLLSHPGHELAKKQMSGFGGMLSFRLAGDGDTATRYAAALKLIQLAESLGGVETLVCYPPLMSHASMTEAERAARGITPNLLRLSVGIEEPEDLIEDLEQAFSTL